jgi:thioredoxin-related protein
LPGGDMKRKAISLLFFLLIVLISNSYTMGVEKQILQKTQPKDSISIEWHKYDKGLDKAKSGNKHIFLFFRTKLCKWCNMMEKTIFVDKDVIHRLNKDFVSIKIDMDSDGKAIELKGKKVSDRDIAQMYNIFSYPYSIFLEPDQKNIGVLPGYVETIDFLLLLEYIGDNHYKKEKFEDFLKRKKQEAKKK